MMSTGVCRWLFLLISLSTWTTITNSKEMRVVCYYTNWSVYRPGAAKFNPQNINPYLCTHLIYAFGGFTKENTLKPFDKYQDIEKGGYAKFTGLKTYNKNLKTMLAIGGWNEGSSRFSPMVASADRRKELVRNTIKFLRQNHFDGLDLDWEYPSFRDGGKPRDRDNYAQLVQELREEFERESEKTGRPRLLLTMAVPAGIEYINKGYDVPKLTKYLDWMNILSYDYHSAFEPAVNHHAPLFSLEEDNEYNYDAELNIDYTVKHYIKLGADPHKLVLGIPTYGRSYTLYNPDAYEIGSPADGPGDMGEATRENGYLAYYEICENIKNQDWAVEQPNPNAMGPYAYKDNQWVGYDDINIVQKKSEYVAENELGGIMFWAIDNDDFRGNCDGKPYPLIEAAKEALINAYGLTDDNLISPPSKPKSRTRSRTKGIGKTKADEEETKPEKISSLSGSRRRNRLKSKNKEEQRDNISTRQKHRRKELRGTTEAATTHSSLKLVTPSYTTPAPPSTPDLDGAFKCEDEGFFPHPKDCKKYFWCLSGAGDSGIVAHQFTCPAGLYFNKAADSCDYSQNVLCNKKLQKPTTTTSSPSAVSTATTTTPTSIVISTSRAPPKITAATSRTTFKVSTTTESIDDEYEYEDDNEEVEEEDDKGKVDSEEDPQVIKELIDLIKKAGGLEELERQLSGSKTDPTSASTDSTTPSAISKSLYERVLNKAVKNSLNAKKNPLLAFRNSRGPQNDGTSKKDETSSSKSDRGKLQYTSISRKRPTTEKSNDDDKDNEEEIEEVKEDNAKIRRTFSNKKYQPEYVTIRRPRVSTTTEFSESESSLDRNKILGESSDEEYEDDDDDEEDNEDEVEENEPNKKSYTPQYVNIQRQRPSTTEESTTSKYTVIRRGSTSTNESAIEVNEETTTSKYKPIRRGSTPSASTTTEQDSSSKYQLRRGTTSQTSTTPSALSDGATSRFKNFRRGSTTPKPATEAENKATVTSTEASVTIPIDDENYVSPSARIVTSSSTETSTTSEFPISTNATTIQSNPEVITTTLPSIINISQTSTSATGTTTPVVDDDKITTLANDIDDKSVVDSNTNGNEKELQDLTKTENVTETPEKSTTATVTDNETDTSQKNNPQLLNPRPLSTFSRGSGSTLKPITEPTIHNSKVSQSNFKFRLRPKISNVVDVSNIQPSTTSESPAPKGNSRFKSRGNSRFTSSNQNVNFNDNEENNEEANANIKIRKRVSTTERYLDENRTYRPSELADLSSLTAVDFAKIKELNFGRATHRRRVRPNTSSTTESSTDIPDDEFADESLKTSSRTLPLARKLVETSSFGQSKRNLPNRTDQINSSSEVNITRKRIRGFGTRTTRQSSTTENYDVISNNNENTTSDTVNITPRSRRVVRRFRTTTSKSVPNKETDVNSKSVETQTVRRRSFIIKKENQTITNNNSTNAAPTLNKNKQNALQRLFNKKPTRLPFIIQKNNVDEDNDDSEEDSSTEEGENIKLSESNIRENSDVNSYDIGGKLNRRPFKLIRTKSDILHGKSNVEKEGIEKTIQTTTKKEPVINESNSEKNMKKGDNIEPNISTENNTEPISTEADTETNITNLETTTEYIAVTLKKNREIKASTQPSIGRTRKIIRKIKPTTTTVTPPTTTTEPITGRKRKIIRRLRPVSGSKQNLEIKSKLYNQTEKEIETKNVFRPTITRPKSKYTAPDLEKQAETTGDLKSPVRIALRKLPSRNSSRNQQRLNSNQNITEPTTNSDEDFAKRIFRPKLSDIKNKYKNLDSSRTESGVNTKRIAFKPFVRSTTTVQNQEVIDITTESFVNKTDLVSESKSQLEETAKAVLFEPIETTTTVNKEEIESFTESLENKLNFEKILDGIENDNTEHPDIIKSDSKEDLETVSTIPLEISTTENSNEKDFENTTNNLKYNTSSEEKVVNEQEQNNEEHLEEVNSTTEQLGRGPLKSFARSTTTIRDENVIETSTKSLKDVSKLEQEYLDKIKSETELQNEQSFPFEIPTTTENNERVTESTTEILGNKINAEQKVTLEEKNNKEPFEKNKSRTQQILKRVPYKSLLRSTTPANSKTVLESATERSRNESLQKSKPKPEQFSNRIKSFKPFFRSTTTITVANKEVIETTTEVLRDESNLEQKNANDEVISTTDAIQINSILTEQNDDKKESYNENIETTNFADYTTIRATENNTENYLDDKDIQNTTIEENLANTTEDVTQTSDKTESYKEFTEAPLSDTVSTVSEEDSFEMRSSTTLYNMETFPSSTVRNDELDNDDEDTATESNGDRRRNYITVFRSSTTSNSFKNFNSENDNEAPKFDELFEDKDKEDKYKELYEEDTKFGDYKGFDGYHFGNHDDNNDEDEYYKYDDDTLIGDTSTEYRNELSYTPNDIVTEEEEKTVQPTETSSKRNHFYHPNRPSFIRPKISISTTERQTLQRPNYKTFARTTLKKEIIQIHSFNNTNEDGSPEKSVNKVLFTNRYKYKTLERTTSAPETVDTNSEDILSFEKDTIPENTTPELQTINTEENLITTKNTETKSIEDDISEDGNLTETTLNDESVTITNLFDATTEISTNNIEEETNLSAANTESATIEIETITDNSLPQTEPDLSPAEITTTESFNESEQSADNSKLISTISTENMLETTDVTTNIPFTGDDLIISDTNQTSFESTTTILPETTTPYRRRSTLRPINSRPKFTPAKRKISYTASSTAEQRAHDSKQKSKFYRNRYQKSTTETSNISASSNTLENDSAPLPINKYLYKQSTTKQPIATEKSNIKTLDNVSTVEKINYDLTKYDSALNTKTDTVLTTAVPLSEFILEHSKIKKTEKVEYGNNENNDYEEDNAEKYDDLNEYEENEKDLDEDLKDKEIEISSVRPQITKPKPSKISNTPSGNRRSNSPIRSNSPLYVGRSTTSRVVNKPVFARTTENSKIPENLSDIDTEAIKNRNKNLFSKQRKVNSPLNAVSEKDSETVLHSTTTDSSLESVTGSQEFITLSPSTTESTSTTNVDETTEYLTTLHHIFAEVNNNETTKDTETTTEAVNSITSTTGKMERLLEVNRIVQIKTKEAKVKNHIVGEQTTAEIVKPVVNKIGEISRVTVIKVVDGNDTIIETVNSLENEIKQTDPISPVYISEEITTKKQETSQPELTYVEIPAKVEEVPAPSILDKINVTNITVTIDKIPELLHTYREDRKFEIFNRPNDLSDINQIVPDKKTEIVEGTSHINVITPRPGFTEASTIALEGLFQSEPTKSPVPVNNVAPNEELLEMEHSKFVNVRVLHPDQSFGKEERDYSKRIPIKLLKQDTEEVTLKAEVVEIKPHNSLDSIKIVPIKVEMSRKISDNLPVFRVTPQDIYTTV